MRTSGQWRPQNDSTPFIVVDNYRLKVSRHVAFSQVIADLWLEMGHAHDRLSTRLAGYFNQWGANAIAAKSTQGRARGSLLTSAHRYGIGVTTSPPLPSPLPQSHRGNADAKKGSSRDGCGGEGTR